MPRMRRCALTAALLFVAAILVANGAWAQEAKPAPAKTDPHAEARATMVRRDIEGRGVKDARVLSVMREVPRHLFVPPAVQAEAYADHPLPIGHGQTISQPYIVGLMTELLEVRPGDRVLEIGTGSGYQAAVLARLAREVFSIEIVEPLAASAKETLARLGFANVTVIAGDGYRGLPPQAPFDRIIVTAAPDQVPKPLIEQLALGGRMVIPLGDVQQSLWVFEKTKRGVSRKKVIDVRFVPMTGEVQSVTRSP